MIKTNKLVTLWVKTALYPGTTYHVGRVVKDESGNEFVLNYYDNKIYSFDALKKEGVEIHEIKQGGTRYSQNSRKKSSS